MKPLAAEFLLLMVESKREYEVKKMTKSQCYSEISRCNQLIRKYQSEIQTLNKEIRELESAKRKVSSLKSTLSSCKNTSVGRLSNTSSVMKVNSKIVKKFFNNMNNLFTGSQYRTVKNGLTNGIERIEEEITTKENRIRTLQNSIESCRNRISQMYATIQRIEEQERAAAAAAAAAEEEE